MGDDHRPFLDATLPYVDVVPFFLDRLLFGATVGGWVCWQAGYARAGLRLQPHRPTLGGAD